MSYPENNYNRSREASRLLERNKQTRKFLFVAFLAIAIPTSVVVPTFITLTSSNSQNNFTKDGANQIVIQKETTTKDPWKTFSINEKMLTRELFSSSIDSQGKMDLKDIVIPEKLANNGFKFEWINKNIAPARIKVPNKFIAEIRATYDDGINPIDQKIYNLELQPKGALEITWDDIINDPDYYDAKQVYLQAGYSLNEKILDRTRGFEAKVIPDGFPIPIDVDYIGPYAFELAIFSGGVVWPNWATLPNQEDRFKTLKIVQNNNEAEIASTFMSAEFWDIDKFTLPTHIKNIPIGMFKDAKVRPSITNLLLDRNITWIDEEAFSAIKPPNFTDTPLIDMTLPNTLIYIGSGAFRNRVLGSNFALPDNGIKLAHNVFENCIIHPGFKIPRSASMLPGGLWEKVATNALSFNTQQPIKWRTSLGLSEFPSPGAIAE